MTKSEPAKGWFTQVSDIAAARNAEIVALRHQLTEARGLYEAMLAELNELRAENDRLRAVVGS